GARMEPPRLQGRSAPRAQRSRCTKRAATWRGAETVAYGEGNRGPGEERAVAAVVLAAGMATRMGVLKQVLPVDGEPMVRRVVRTCLDRKSTRLNSSHVKISYAVFCVNKKKKNDP